jgi:hypothetical protein
MKDYNWCKEIGVKELEEFQINGIPWNVYRIKNNVLEVSVNNAEFKVSKGTKANQVDDCDIVKVRRK